MIFSYGIYHCNNKAPFVIDRWAGINDYALILCHSPAYFREKDTTYLLKPYQLFIYEIHKPQYFYDSGEDFYHDWIHFQMTPKDKVFFEQLNIPFAEPISVSNPLMLSAMIKNMVGEKSCAHPHYKEILHRQLECFFMSIADMKISHDDISLKHRHYLTLYAIKKKMEMFPGQQWNISQLAASAYMSISSFQHNYREIFNISFNEDLIQCRIRYAQDILANSDMSVINIAAHCGYANSVHFMRQFKKLTGVTPSQYREQVQT